MVGRRYFKARNLWLGRFTPDERATIWALCNGEAVPNITITLKQRYRLASFRDVTLNGAIRVDHPELIQVVQALESVGVLAPGRAAEILDY